MAGIVEDVSPETLKAVSAAHYFDSFTCFSVVPGVELYQSEEMIRVASPGIPNWLTNTVVRCRLPSDRADSIIDETNAYFHARGVEPYWRLLPGDLPSDLGERLVSRGLRLVQEEPAMAVDLAKLNQDISPPAGLKIERVTSRIEMQEKHGWIRSLGPGRSLGTLMLEMWSVFGFGPDSTCWHYLGLLNGQPVAWTSTWIAAGIVGVYGVGTLAEARRQGIASALVVRGLLDARDRGYRVATLQSSEMGYNVYRRLGFETCFTIQRYALGETIS